MNIGLSAYGEMAKAAAGFKGREIANEVPYIRAKGPNGLDLTYLPRGGRLTEGKDSEIMAANRDIRSGLLEEIRKDLRRSNLDESNLMVRAFLTDAAKQLNCGQTVKPEDAGQDLESATVKDLLDRLEVVKANANEGPEDVDLEMLTNPQTESLAHVLGLSDESQLKGIKFTKTPERAYGSAVFEAEVPSGDEANPRRVRVLMQKNGLFKLESKAAASGVSAGEVDLQMLDDRQLTSLVKALGLSDRNALNGIGFAKTGERENKCDVFEAAIFKPGAVKPMYVRVLMGEDGAFKPEGDVERKKPTLPKLPTRPKKKPSANPNVVTEIENPPAGELNELQRIRKNLKSPWAPGQEPGWWKEAMGLKS